MQSAIHTLLYHTVARTPENLAALRAVAERGSPKMAADARKALDRMERQSANSTWEPDRR